VQAVLDITSHYVLVKSMTEYSPEHASAKEITVLTENKYATHY